MALSILDRLKQKTIYKDTCWLYTGGNDGRKGYGKIRFLGKKVAVHRVSCHLFHKLDLNDKSLRALHKLECLNKNCWNPEHLYIGTDKDNGRDMIDSGILINRKVGNHEHERSPVWPRRNR